MSLLQCCGEVWGRGELALEGADALLESIDRMFLWLGFRLDILKALLLLLRFRGLASGCAMTLRGRTWAGRRARRMLAFQRAGAVVRRHCDGKEPLVQ